MNWNSTKKEILPQLSSYPEVQPYPEGEVKCLILFPYGPVSRIMSCFPSILQREHISFANTVMNVWLLTDPVCFNTLQILFFLYPSLITAVPSLPGKSLCILAPVCFRPFVTAQWSSVASLLLVWQYVTGSSWTFPAPTWNQPTFLRAPGCFQWEM